MCQSVPDCVSLCQGLFFRLDGKFEHSPCLAHELALILRSVQPSGYARSIVYDPDSAVPTCRDLLFLSFKTTESLAKSCAKLVCLSDCSKVFKRSRAQAAIAPEKRATAMKLEPSFRLIQVLRTLKTAMTKSGIVIALAPPRMPSPLPVEFQSHPGAA